MPNWPKTYKLKGYWRIPYQNINQPFTVYTDLLNNRQFEDTYNGQQRVLTIENVSYTIQQSVDDFVPQESCYFNVFSQSDNIINYLPTNQEDYVLLNGSYVINGKKARVFEYYFNESLGYYNRYYLDYDTYIPLRIETNGTSIRHSHPSLYIFDIYEYGIYIDDVVFIPPGNCTGSDNDGPSKKKRMILTGYRGSSSNSGDSLYCQYTNFADVTLPEEFSWRNTSLVVPNTRDQANCGSCWAQGVAQSLSSAFRIMLNKSVNISVNQIMDCAWNDTNRACLGGDHDSALYLLSNRSIPLTTEENYPYIGISGHCVRDYEDIVGYVKGCYQVPQNSDDLKKALYTSGPLSVAIYADPEFYFYSGGVYKSSSKTSYSQLNHVVTLTGWKRIGETLCWEIQNSWSDVWGENGFGYISTDADSDMGITLSVFIPKVSLTLQ